MGRVSPIADDQGDEPLGWRPRSPDDARSHMQQYVASMKATYSNRTANAARLRGFTPEQIERVNR